MNSMLMAIAGFVGATIGSIVAGVAVEYYRQGNRLQLAAVEKRLETYQAAVNWIAQIGGRLAFLKKQGQSPIGDDRLEGLRTDATIWFRESYLYLGPGVDPVLWKALNSDDEKDLDEACDLIEKVAGLPRLGEKRGWFLVGGGQR